MGIHVSDIKIASFKSLSNLEIRDLREISLITGRNDTGKSSVLEVLFLLFNYADPGIFAEMNLARVAQTQNRSGNIWTPLFYGFDPDNEIGINVTFDKKKLDLIFKKDADFGPRHMISLPEKPADGFRTAVKERHGLKSVFSEDGKITAEMHFGTDGKGMAFRQNEGQIGASEAFRMSCVTLITNAGMRFGQSAVDMFGKIELQGKKDQVVRYMGLLDEDISDIFTVSDNNTPVLYARTGAGTLPVDFLGNGAVKLLDLILAVMTAERGLVLVDDIETGFHHSMYPKLWKILLELSSEFDCQIIAATQSRENIAGAIGACSADPEKFSLYRIGCGKKGMQANRFSFELADKAIKAGLEIR